MQRRLGLDLEIPDEFGIGLAWYTAAEASFMANIYQRKSRKELRLEYRIGLRADDFPALEYIRDMLGVGRIARIKPNVRQRRPNPMAVYRIERIGDLYHVIVPLFERYPIPFRFKKATDFEIWKEIVDIDYHEGTRRSLGRAPSGRYLGNAPLPESYWDKIEPLVEQLKAAREFNG